MAGAERRAWAGRALLGTASWQLRQGQQHGDSVAPAQGPVKPFKCQKLDVDLQIDSYFAMGGSPTGTDSRWCGLKG